MDQFHFQVAKNILTDVEFDMDSMASGIESEPVDDNMSGIEKWIHAGKKKKRMSKRDRKKSSSAAHHVSFKKLNDEMKSQI